MTPKDFRRIALALPDAIEAAHMGHPDFRVGKKIFATLGYPDAGSAMVKLTPAQQAALVAAEPKVFAQVRGGWGRGGSTHVRLKAADNAMLKRALAMAWRNIAPKALVDRQDGACTPGRGGTAKAFSGAMRRMRGVVKRARLPGIEEGMAYGTPALKVQGKFLMRVKDDDTLVFRCAVEMKEMLIEAAPDIYFETDHYKGWPAILVRLSKADDAELQQCLQRAWQLQAPKKLLVRQAEGTAAPAKKSARRKAARQ